MGGGGRLSGRASCARLSSASSASRPLPPPPLLALLSSSLVPRPPSLCPPPIAGHLIASRNRPRRLDELPPWPAHPCPAHPNPPQLFPALPSCPAPATLPPPATLLPPPSPPPAVAAAVPHLVQYGEPHRSAETPADSRRCSHHMRLTDDDPPPAIG